MRRVVESDMGRGIFLGLVVLAALWAFGLILLPFLVPIAWALCLVTVTQRPYHALAQRLGRPRLAALLLTLATPIVLLVPFGAVAILLWDEIQQLDIAGFVADLRAEIEDPTTARRVGGWLDDVAEWLGRKDFAELAGELHRGIQESAPSLLLGRLAPGVVSVLIAPFVFLFGLLVMLVTQYFVYCEAPRLLRIVTDISPFERDETDRILEALRSTTTAAIVGGLLVALLQGFLGGVAFLIVGLSAPVLWSLVMAVVSLLPFGGTALVWVPASLWLLFTDRIWQGIFVIGWGTLIVGASDNVLRPWLLRRTGAKDIHPLLLFFAILSGIGLFGIGGIVFGPLLLAIVVTVIRILRTRAHAREASP